MGEIINKLFPVKLTDLKNWLLIRHGVVQVRSLVGADTYPSSACENLIAVGLAHSNSGYFVALNG